MNTRFGVVDMGSNAIRVLIAEIGEAGQAPVVIESHRAPVRLGRDVFLTGQIPEASIEATVDVLSRFKESCDRHQVSVIEAIATSAMRDARNSREMAKRVKAATGIELRVISGTDEAYYLLRAVKQRLAIDEGRSLLVDLGGGSVEIDLVQDGEVASSDSYGLGALRVLQALENESVDQQGASFLSLIDDYIGAVEGRIKEHFGKGKVDRYVATGGNIEAICDILGAEGKTFEVDGVEACKLEDLEDLTRQLALKSYAERMEEWQLRPDRADTILPAAVVYTRLGRAARVDAVLVPRVGMREGLLRELAARIDRGSLEAEQRDLLLASCRAIGRRYHYDATHAEASRRLAASIFDQCGKLHELEEHDRTLLEAAAVLHDIGVFVNNSRHHKHSWYLIRSSDIVGLTQHERELVALLARYHRRSHPTAKHYPWNELTEIDQRRVLRLSAILRIADCLDRSHQDKIADVKVKLNDKIAKLKPVLNEGVESDLLLERLGMAKKSELFAEAFDRRVEF